MSHNKQYPNKFTLITFWWDPKIFRFARMEFSCGNSIYMAIGRWQRQKCLKIKLCFSKQHYLISFFAFFSSFLRSCVLRKSIYENHTIGVVALLFGRRFEKGAEKNLYAEIGFSDVLTPFSINREHFNEQCVNTKSKKNMKKRRTLLFCTRKLMKIKWLWPSVHKI